MVLAMKLSGRSAGFERTTAAVCLALVAAAGWGGTLAAEAAGLDTSDLNLVLVGAMPMLAFALATLWDQRQHTKSKSNEESRFQ